MGTPHERLTPPQEQLLQEKLSHEELRLLLERLQARDLSEPEQPTVGAVVEATGVDPVSVGTVLAEIRREQAPQVLDALRTPTTTRRKWATMLVAFAIAIFVVLLMSLMTVRVSRESGPSGMPQPVVDEGPATPTGTAPPALPGQPKR